MKNNQTGFLLAYITSIVVLIVFKLINIISASWLIILAPLYLPFLIVMFVLAGVFSIVISVVIADKILDFLISIFSKQ